MKASSYSPALVPSLRLTNLARARYVEEPTLGALDSLISAWRNVVNHEEFAVSSSLFRSTAFNNLGGSLLLRYEQTGKVENLRESRILLENALELTPEGSPEIAGRWSNLGIIDKDLYLLTSDSHWIDHAVADWEMAVATVQEESSDHGAHLSHLGLGLLIRYQDSGNLRDLDRALVCCRQSVAISSRGSADMASRWNNLGLVLREDYSRKGELAELSEAIEAFKKAISFSVDGMPDLPRFENNLGISEHAYYDHTGELEALERAVHAYSRSVESTPHGSPDLGRHLSNLGTGLSSQAKSQNDPGVLDQAIATFERSVAVTLASSRDQAMNWNNLSAHLQERYSQKQDRSDLERAIEFSQEAVSAALDAAPEKALFQACLANALDERYSLDRNLQDLDAAVDLYRRVVDTVPATAPKRSLFLDNLAVCLDRRFQELLQPRDLEQAVLAWRESVSIGLRSSLWSGFHSARNWGNSAFGRQSWNEAATAYSLAMKAFEVLFAAQVADQEKKAWLRAIHGVPARLAYARARSGDLQGAVEALEQGRGRWIQSAFDRFREEVQELAAKHPNIFRRYRKAADKILRLGDEKLTPDIVPRESSAPLREEFDESVLAIRALPDFERFLELPSFNDAERGLRSLSSPAALVYLVTTSGGAMVLLVTQFGLKVSWPEFPQSKVEEFLLRSAGNEVEGGYLPAIFGEVGIEKELPFLLSELGRLLIGPIAESLSKIGIRHVVLLPVGRLGVLPLHAAECSLRGERRPFFEYFTTRYALTAHGLNALSQRAAAVRDRRFLGVSNPSPGPPPLPGAEAEVAEIGNLFGKSDCQILYGNAAAKDKVLDEISTATYIHFACHGEFDSRTPLNSSLRLVDDRRLRLRDLLYGRIKPLAARLVVLSACQTAIVDFQNLPEEQIGFPGGFLQAGAPGAIGTLWRVEDASTALLMVKFYSNLLLQLASNETGQDPAMALSEAQSWLRQVTAKEALSFLERYPRLQQAIEKSLDVAGLTARISKSDDSNQPLYGNRPSCWAAFVYVGV